MCKVLKHALAGQAPGKTTLAAVDVHTVAIPNMQHEELSALADLCMFCAFMHSRTCSGVTH